jgi:ribosome biogenesis protein UTP30
MANEEQLKMSVKQASSSLLTYIQKKSNTNKKSSLFDSGDVLSGETVQLIVGLKKIPEQGKAKPISLSIPHSLYKAEDGASICMFVKDNSEELKKKLTADPVDGLERVISLSALRRNYKEYKDRRKLVASHDLFLADDRITPMLTKALGKIFLRKKKQPVAIRLNRGSLNRTIERKRNCTYLFLGWGACCSVKVGRTDFSSKQVSENVMAAIEALVQKVPRKWRNIQSMHLKSTSSIALPIYNALPEVHSEIGDGVNDGVDDSKNSTNTTTSSSKKRRRETEEEEEESEKKVAKSSNKKQKQAKKKKKTPVASRFQEMAEAEKKSKKGNKRKTTKKA